MRLNSIVPNFEADSTQGPINLYDWQGDSWVVLFSHPADFTPVCTTELGRLAVHKPHFEKRNTKLLALSVDQLDDHVDWVNDIKSYCQDIPGDFPYPIVADPDRSLAVQLGMIDEEGKRRSGQCHDYPCALRHQSRPQTPAIYALSDLHRTQRRRDSESH